MQNALNVLFKIEWCFDLIFKKVTLHNTTIGCQGLSSAYSDYDFLNFDVLTVQHFKLVYLRSYWRYLDNFLYFVFGFDGAPHTYAS